MTRRYSSRPDPRRRRAVVVALFSLPAAMSVAAQDAGRTRRIVTGFPPGGSADALARLMSEGLHAASGDSVIVENRVGAGGRVAIEHVRTAAADGSVLLLVPDATMFLYPYVFHSLTYEPARDFKPVARLVGISIAMFLGPMVPADVDTVPAFVAWARRDPSRQVFGTPAAGATPHFVGAIFSRSVGLPMLPVHFRGAAPGIQDLAGGHLPVFFGAVSDGLAMQRAGKIRVLATTGRQRAASLPDAPTFAELGFPELVVEDGLGVYLPARADAHVVDRTAGALLAVLQSAGVRDAAHSAGFEISGEGAQQFAAHLQRERTRWGAIVRATGFAAAD